MRASLGRRVARLEARRRAAERRVRYVWWRGRGPHPEPAEGERLVVLRWQGEDDAAPCVAAAEAAGAAETVTIPKRQHAVQSS